MLLFATSGKVFDFIRAHECTSLTNLRKIFNTIGNTNCDCAHGQHKLDYGKCKACNQAILFSMHQNALNHKLPSNTSAI